MALNKQVWTSQLMRNFYPEYLFLTYAQDFTNLVENDKIHIPEMGADPNVLINNITYPIAVTERVDIDQEITLDEFDTENTMVRNAEAVEMAYDKVESVIYGHKQTLSAETASKAAHAYSPNANTINTPVIITTGEDNGEGYKRMLPKDILKLGKLWTKNNIPLDGRYLVLDPDHLEDLIEFDLKAFKDITDLVDGKPKRFGGFNILVFANNPRYNATTLVKSAFGSVTGAPSSFAFHNKEVMKADGSVKMFSTIDDPKERASIIGFNKRFVAMAIRNKGIGAIVSKPV
jgi:hypothetical protein